MTGMDAPAHGSEPTDVPIIKSLEEIYDPEVIPEQSERWNRLRERFSQEFGHEPAFIVRSPGRANLIGEHVDYSYFSVLPCAILADVLIAVSPNESREIKLINENRERFPDTTITLPEHAEQLEIDSKKLEWSNYVRAGFRKAGEVLESKTGKVSVGINMFVDGNVPVGGGVSSSAAFVCSAALAVFVCNGITQINKLELVSVAMDSERFVGINSGGMDQTASVCGQKGYALFISFAPKLSVEPIPLASVANNLSFVLANTLVKAEKHDSKYNDRAVEVAVAAEIIERKYELGPSKYRSSIGATLYGATELYFSRKNIKTPCFNKDCLREMRDLVLRTFPKDDYTFAEVAEMLGMEETDFTESYIKKFRVRSQKLLLRQRAQHVFEEEMRVFQFQTGLLNKENKSFEEVAQSLGNILNESQKSLRDLFDCSCPEIEELTAISRSHGAYGSRLTGAGWGGMTCSMIAADKTAEFITALKRDYFAKKFPTVTDLDQVVFAFKPAGGSAIMKI